MLLDRGHPRFWIPEPWMTVTMKNTLHNILFSYYSFLCCPTGWVSDGISYYYMMSSKFAKMTDARQQCQNLGADLPIISSAKENNLILDLLEKEGKKWAWLGLQRNISDLEFYWVNGSELRGKYQNWSDGEPNNSGGLEHCAYIKGHRDINKGQWNDCGCEFPSARLSPSVVCQKTI